MEESIGEKNRTQKDDEAKALFDVAIESLLSKHKKGVQKKIGETTLREHGFGERSPRDPERLSISDLFDRKELIADDEGDPKELPSVSDLFDLGDMLSSPEVGSEALEGLDLSTPAEKIKYLMGALIRKNTVDAARKYFGLKKAGAVAKLVLDIAMGESKDFSSRDKVIDRLADVVDGCEGDLESLATVSPESHVVVHGYELREHVEELESGGIITTPYVAEHMRRLGKNMEKGQPTFIHGHLGSGKTELAISTAKRTAITRAAREAAEKECKDFIAENPDSPKSERREVLGRAYRRSISQFEQALRRGDSEATERFTPLIISGSKDLTSQDLFTDKTLRLTKFNGKTLLEHKEELDQQVAEWKEKHPEEAKDPEKAKRAADEILELYKLKNSAFGTEVETIRQAVYRGVEEGRPVIIDEVNAIPAAILISLNDILQRRPGQFCFIPGAKEPVKMAEGFSITMTGNLNVGGINYVGTDELNPALISRLDVIEHDYLPMSETDASFERQADPKKNELFQVAIAYLVDRHGDLELPEMDRSLEKIFRLCQFARVTQKVFSGKWEESNVLKTESDDEMEPNLETSVLSMRNLLNVLRDWNKGLEKDLDKALWDSFISTAINPDDQNMLIALARQYGFFSEADGYTVRVKEYGKGATSWDEIHPGKYEYSRKQKPLEVCDLRRVVDVLYGEAPEREVYPDIDLSELEEEVDDEPTIEDFVEFGNTLTEVDKAIRALEILGEQCGCPANEGDTVYIQNAPHNE